MGLCSKACSMPDWRRVFSMRCRRATVNATVLHRTCVLDTSFISCVLDTPGFKGWLGHSLAALKSTRKRPSGVSTRTIRCKHDALVHVQLGTYTVQTPKCLFALAGAFIRHSYGTFHGVCMSLCSSCWTRSFEARSSKTSARTPWHETGSEL
jgi:hypothetical protein